MKHANFITGFVLGALVFSGTTAYAAGIMAERSTNRIFVDGKEVQIEAYAIHDNNFMQLRDVGKAVGFNVYWNAADGSVQIETGKPYTGEAQTWTSTTKTVTLPTDGSQYVPQAGDVIRCDDGTNYTITDVSRWNANLFSSGPVGELPVAPVTGAGFPKRSCPRPTRGTSKMRAAIRSCFAISTKRAVCSTRSTTSSAATAPHGTAAVPTPA